MTSLSFHLSWDGNDDHNLAMRRADGSYVDYEYMSSGSCSLSEDTIPGSSFTDSSTTVFTEIITCTDPPPGLYEYDAWKSGYITDNYDPYTLSVYVNGVPQHQATYTSDSGWQTFTL